MKYTHKHTNALNNVTATQQQESEQTLVFPSLTPSKWPWMNSNKNENGAKRKLKLIKETHKQLKH